MGLTTCARKLGSAEALVERRSDAARRATPMAPSHSRREPLTPAASPPAGGAADETTDVVDAVSGT
eukprot:scaffold28012_cov32-Tisochrysis_lutea.AAC.6